MAYGSDRPWITWTDVCHPGSFSGCDRRTEKSQNSHVANVPNPSSKTTTPSASKAKTSPKPTPQPLVKPHVIEKSSAILSQPKLKHKGE
ncbi:hypothetical protein H6F89_23985 [Cyanobacteria bacterium FACHB-63]|nr:hypothetical protein [Cyanobacteria bacterium FACHB-63]